MSTPVLSLEPVARRRPSGDHFVYQTSSQWSASVWIVSQGKSSFEHWWSTERKEGSILKVAAVGSVSGGGGGNEKGESARLANDDRLWYRHLKDKSRRFHIKSFIGYNGPKYVSAVAYFLQLRNIHLMTPTFQFGIRLPG